MWKKFRVALAGRQLYDGRCRAERAHLGSRALRLGIAALALVGFGIQGTNAGTEVIRDYGAQEPAYNYAPAPPPPRPIYYAPPAVGVVLYPTFYPGYHRFYGHHHYYAHRPYWHH